MYINPGDSGLLSFVLYDVEMALSSLNRHDITEILLKVALNTINQLIQFELKYKEKTQLFKVVTFLMINDVPFVLFVLAICNVCPSSIYGF
jgi:hypothetical protein